MRSYLEIEYWHAPPLLLSIFLLLLRIVESSVSVWRVSVNKTQHLNKALVPIRWRPLIICLSPCCLWRQINTSPWHAFFSHFARFLVPRLEQEESRTPWQSNLQSSRHAPCNSERTSTLICQLKQLKDRLPHPTLMGLLTIWPITRPLLIGQDSDS